MKWLLLVCCIFGLIGCGDTSNQTSTTPTIQTHAARTQATLTPVPVDYKITIALRHKGNYHKWQICGPRPTWPNLQACANLKAHPDLLQEINISNESPGTRSISDSYIELASFSQQPPLIVQLPQTGSLTRKARWEALRPLLGQHAFEQAEHQLAQ